MFKIIRRNMGTTVRMIIFTFMLWGTSNLLISTSKAAAYESDELSELKNQMKAMEKRHEEEILQVQKRIEKLEAAQNEMPVKIEERISRLEKGVPILRKGNVFTGYWKNGLEFKTADEAFKFKIGGRIKNDWAFIQEDKNIRKTKTIGKQEDGTEIRSARVSLDGILFKRFEFKSEFEFSGGNVEFKDAYIGLRKVIIFRNVRVGQFTEPFSLEEKTSSRFSTFMERPLSNAFAPGRNIGAMLSSLFLHERMTSAVGIFRNTDAFGGRGTSGDGEYNETVRITGLPWYTGKGEHLLHLGISFSHRNNNDNQLRIRERPEAHLVSHFVDTHTFTAKAMDLYGGESALVYGPFSLQGEYVKALVNAKSSGDPHFNGFYFYGSYFLTGEHRIYDPETGTFTRIKPKNNFLAPKNGPGAWEVAVRYSTIDLTDQLIFGRKLNDITVGVNWYLNPNLRVMWNYTFADLDPVDGAAHIFQTRFQVDF